MSLDTSYVYKTCDQDTSYCLLNLCPRQSFSKKLSHGLDSVALLPPDKYSLRKFIIKGNLTQFFVLNEQ